VLWNLDDIAYWVPEDSAEIAEQVKAAYEDNFQRLADSKREYDPTNLFRLSQNIGPS
jgi:FAD/FMN-containing dehydrogenase